jgi:hypothetical protein
VTATRPGPVRCSRTGGIGPGPVHVSMKQTTIINYTSAPGCRVMLQLAGLYKPAPLRTPGSLPRASSAVEGRREGQGSLHPSMTGRTGRRRIRRAGVRCDRHMMHAGWASAHDGCRPAAGQTIRATGYILGATADQVATQGAPAGHTRHPQRGATGGSGQPGSVVSRAWAMHRVTTNAPPSSDSAGPAGIDQGTLMHGCPGRHLH